MTKASMVLGVIAAFVGLPASICSGACAAGISAAGDASHADADSAGNVFMVLGLIAVVLAIVGAVTVMRDSKKGGWITLVAFLVAAVTCVTLNPLAFLEALLLLVAGILGLSAKSPAAA